VTMRRGQWCRLCRLLAPATVAVVGVTSVSAMPTHVATTSVTYSDPAWAPRGGKIAFVAVTTVTDGESSTTSAALETMPVGGGRIRVIVRLRPDRLAWPSWSPDARRIAFGSDRLLVISATGGRRRDLGGGCCPAWGPGGRRIAFSTGPETQSEIFVVNPDGSRRQVVATPDDVHSFWGPTWSPGGQKLAFFADAAPDTASPPKTSLAVITRFGGRVRYFASARAAVAPDWSPDGTRIAFDGIRVLDLRTNRVMSLHRGRHASWSPDSRRLAFADGGAIFVMNADGSNVRRLTP
jgi:Tol biopolymer transport system component